MHITYKEKLTDPVYPIMHGISPLAKEFNKRQKELWKKGNIKKIDFEFITTVLLEIFADDYNKRNSKKHV